MVVPDRLDCLCLNAGKTVISDAVTAILTVWKRNHLEEQLSALFGQTVSPAQVWIQQSEHHVDVSKVIEKEAGMAIQSILQQMWEDFELILVCTDKSGISVNGEDKRIRWIETKEELVSVYRPFGHGYGQVT